jgi:hypothetical protein
MKYWDIFILVLWANLLISTNTSLYSVYGIGIVPPAELGQEITDNGQQYASITNPLTGSSQEKMVCTKQTNFDGSQKYDPVTGAPVIDCQLSKYAGDSKKQTVSTLLNDKANSDLSVSPENDGLLAAAQSTIYAMGNVIAGLTLFLVTVAKGMVYIVPTLKAFGMPTYMVIMLQAIYNLSFIILILQIKMGRGFQGFK